MTGFLDWAELPSSAPTCVCLVGWAEYGWPCSALIEVIAGLASYYQRKMVFLGAVLLLICGPIIVFRNFSISLV